MAEVYKNVDIDLSAATSGTAKAAVPGAEAGAAIYGVNIVQNNFPDTALPAGAQVKLFFGSGGDEILLSPDMTGFNFPCGHEDGIYYQNLNALPGKVLRLLLDYSGGMVNYAS